MTFQEAVERLTSIETVILVLGVMVVFGVALWFYNRGDW